MNRLDAIWRQIEILMLRQLLAGLFASRYVIRVVTGYFGFLREKNGYHGRKSSCRLILIDLIPISKALVYRSFFTIENFKTLISSLSFSIISRLFSLSRKILD